MNIFLYIYIHIYIYIYIIYGCIYSIVTDIYIMHICVYRYIYVDVCIHEIILVTIKTSRYKINKLRGFSYTYLVAQFFSN